MNRASAGEKGDAISVVLVEVKKGKGKLNRVESLIKRAVEEGRVSWQTIFLNDDADDVPGPVGK
jgi:predicted Holliday junction resolvase-like endonuclease